jgi:broad specificity phosphatase PhoE
MKDSVRCALFAVTLSMTIVAGAAAQEALVQIYLVRHPETEARPVDPTAIHLSTAGHQRAALLVPTVAGVRLSHLFASHTVRTRETLEPLAADRSLPIVQLPEPTRSLGARP